VNELLAGFLGWRADHLEKGIRSLLGDSNLAQRVWDHGVIRGLAGRSDRDPSYIPAQSFAKVLFDVLVPEQGNSATIDSVVGSVKLLPDSNVKAAMLTFIDSSAGNVALLRSQVEDWFNASMDRVSGVYKRQVQLVTLALSVFVTVALGIDTIALAQTLWQEPAVRAALGGAAQAASPNIEDPLATLSEFDLPIGWTLLPDTFVAWVLKVVGLALTVFAISLGAPFWFDLIKKLNPRSSGPPPEPSR
jgi:hypothetical protein